ncbi:MAG: tRNA (adenosine(37)-N6)-dimethylallyltransferase MiaA [Paenisporosarcina sp.]
MNLVYDVLAIVGPTASGKTALSIQLAKDLNGEIINGDSMQVYRGLDIGTAKIKKHEMEGIPHHLIDIKEPIESFSVAEFQQLVRLKIKEIQERGKLPIIVGGTGLYIQAVLYDYQFTEDRVNEEVRQEYYDELEKQGAQFMHDRLKEVDPETANNIHPNNSRRVIRALEIAEHSPVQKSDPSQNQGNTAIYKHLIIGLDIDRDILYERINLRVDRMLEEGLLLEVKTLWNNGVRNVQSVQAIGYKELYLYFEGEISYDEAIIQLKQNSRRYAKRQFTYFRNKMTIHWINPLQGVDQLITEIHKLMQESTR